MTMGKPTRRTPPEVGGDSAQSRRAFPHGPSGLANLPPIFGLGPFGEGPSSWVKGSRIDERHPLFFNFEEFLHENNYEQPQQIDYQAGVASAFLASTQDKGTSQVSQLHVNHLRKKSRVPLDVHFYTRRKDEGETSSPIHIF